jgi:hypothetical protein
MLLFGDAATSDRWLHPCNAGDLAFLLDFDADELIGVFENTTGTADNLEPDAWGGAFPGQVRVRPLGVSVVLGSAGKVLRAAGVQLRALKGRGRVPRGFCFDAAVSRALVQVFRETGFEPSVDLA